MTTPFVPLSGFPAVAEDADSSFAFFYRAGNAEQPHLLAYECARDFKSVPRTFAVLSLVALETDAVELNIEADDIPPDPGVYHWPDSEACYGEDQCHFLLVTAERNFEMLAHSCQLSGRIYHVQTSAQALQDFLLKREAE